jgi:hypothetical protein
MRLRPAEIDFKSVKLTPEEGYVLSRLDGPVEADQIAAITGLPGERVDEIVDRMVKAGILIPEGNQSPSMIPSVPPDGGSSVPADGGLGDVMVPSAAGLPEIGPGGLPPGATSLDDWAAGLPPGVALLDDAEPPPSSELPPGVTPLDDPESSNLPAGVASIAPLETSQNGTSLEPGALSALVPSFQPLEPESTLPPGVAEFPSEPPGVATADVGTARERAVTTPEVPHARAVASSRAPADLPSAAGLPAGLLPSLEGERVLPPGVPDIFGFGDGDPKVEAAPLAGAAASVARASSSRPPRSQPEASSRPPRSQPVASSRPPQSVRPGAGSGPAEGDARKRYAERFRAMSSAEKIEIAPRAVEPDLSALCFDPEPQIIAAVLGNPQAGLSHARLMALHHRNGVGIEMITRRGELFRDQQVQHNLLRNPQIPEAVLQRMIGGKRLLDLYRDCVDRDFPENVRGKLRGALKKRFGTGNPDEKAELVMRTEGRVLHLLGGCTFDGKTTQILCGRTFASAVLIQNLAKFTATPPALLAKVVQQPFVSRQPGLKNLLLRHPNMPGDVKRRG